MLSRSQKKENTINLFLRDYFNMVIIAIVILVLIASYFFLLRPKFNDTKNIISSNLADQERLYQGQEKKLAGLKALSEAYKKIPAADLQKFNAVLPDDYPPERLFGELEEIVTRSGFILDSVAIIKPDESKKADDSAPAPSGDDDSVLAAVNQNKQIGHLEIELNLSAIDYAGLKNLLRVFENNLRLFNVNKVDFTAGSQAAQISLFTYYYKKAQ